MGKGFFKQNLASSARPRAVGAGVAEAVRQDGDGRTEGEGVPGGAAKKERPAAVYTDESVCAALGVRRRHLAAARTRAARGRDWDCAGLRAGMTRGWVEAEARRLGLDADRARDALEAARSGDGVVSVRRVGLTPSPCVCIVELEADGSREHARVRDMREHPLQNGECFDCVRVGARLEWTAKGNRARW